MPPPIGETHSIAPITNRRNGKCHYTIATALQHRQQSPYATTRRKRHDDCNAISQIYRAGTLHIASHAATHRTLFSFRQLASASLFPICTVYICYPFSLIGSRHHIVRSIALYHISVTVAMVTVMRNLLSYIILSHAISYCISVIIMMV